MSIPEIIMLAAIFLSVFSISAIAVGMLMPGAAQARLRALSQGTGASVALDAPEPAWKATLSAALSPAGKLTLPEEGWENSPLRRQFIHAGIRSDKTIMLFFGVKTLLTLALPIGFLLAMGISHLSLTFDSGLVYVVALAAAGYYLPNYYLRRRAYVRQREIFEKLPDAIDLMTVMVEAGLGLDAAMSRVGEEIGGQSRVLDEEFHLVGLELRAGAGREQALRNLALRNGVEELDLLVAMLVQTDRFGTSMAESLRVHSDGLRTKRRLKAEEAAAKISLKLVFPLVFCIFPSIMIVLMGPAVISIYRIFFPIAHG
jgi:tight adherence protein C